MEKNLNDYIKKSHIRAVEKFNEELRKWSEYTNGTPDGDAELYEDANTSFTLADVRVDDGRLKYRYDGREEYEEMLWVDEEDGSLSEKEGLDSIPGSGRPACEEPRDILQWIRTDLTAFRMAILKIMKKMSAMLRVEPIKQNK